MTRKLAPCLGMWGESHLMYGDPEIARIQNAIYVPYSGDRPWGLYTPDRQIITASVDLRGSDRTPHHQINWEDRDITIDATRRSYIYCGRLNPHFGHFIINSLPRFWPIWKKAFSSRPKILCAGPVTRLPGFMSSILAGFGLNETDFAWFDDTTQLSDVFVPTPCLLEQYWVYTLFKDMCGEIGRPWYNDKDVDTVATPAYFSKSALTSGVGRFVNEHVVEGILKQFGFDIIRPERLPMHEQVKLFASRRVCLGPTGSAFHSTIFAPRRRTLVCYNPADKVNSNFVLLDMLNENDATYLYQPDMSVKHHEEGFLTSVTLADPTQVAYDLLEQVEARCDWRRSS